MSFAIEVPGDAVPLSLQDLCRTLQSATSNDHVQRQASGQQLTSWESRPGYYSALQSLFLDRSIPHDIRFSSVLQLKNGIDRNWRLHSNVKNGMSIEEKDLIRSRLFQGTIGEEERILALHNALVVAKIVRIDFPTAWPDAIPSIIAHLRSLRNGNQQHLSGALLILLRVVKELGTARLRKSQTALQAVAPEAVYVLAEIYSEKAAIWASYLSNRGGNDAEANQAMLNSLCALKILRRLIIFGFDRPNGDSSVEEFWTLSQNQFGQLFAFISDESSVPEPYQEVVGKHLLQFSKLHIDMAEQHAASFAFLPNSLSLVHAYWNLVSKFAEAFDKSGGIRQSVDENAKTEGPLLEKLTLKGLVLLRACMRIAFRPTQSFKFRSAETKAEDDQARSLVKNELFKDELVIQIANSIISHLFVMRKSDLEAWEEDPEEWEKQEETEGSAYEWEVRPCAEKLFLDLLTNYKQLLVPPLLAYFQTAQSPQADIATKEAVYTAMGLSASHVGNDFDFDAVLSSTIVNDAQQRGGLYKVLRRRIAILISQWATVKLSNPSRPLVYQIFRHFLDPSDETNDLVVRISAARQLRWIADEIDFNVDAFLPYASDILTALIELVQSVESDDTRLAILESLRILVARMNEMMPQFGDQLMAALPSVWENSGEHGYMVKQAIISIFTALVQSMGTNSQRYHNFMIPLLSEAARPGSDLHMHLIDETLELWDAILLQSHPPLAPDVIKLAEMTIPLLEHQHELAFQALQLIESYILIAPDAILGDGLRRPMLTALSDTLDSKSHSQVAKGTVCLEYLIRFAAEMGGAGGVSIVIQDLMESGFIGKIMDHLLDAWEVRQTTGPNRRTGKITTVTEGHYLAILGRIALAEPGLFAQMLGTFGPWDQVCSWLLSEWFSHQSSMDNLVRQKLYLLGLTRLLELPSPMQEVVLGKLQDYIDMWLGVIAELQDGVADGQDTLIWGPDPEDSEYDTPRMILERQMASRDPVHSVNALHFVKERLQDVISRVGGKAAFQEQWAVNVDQVVMQKFQKMLTS